MDGFHRMVVSGRNNAISPTAFQDAVAAAKPEPGMELYSAMIRARTAAEYLLITHVERRNGNATGVDLNHMLAMQQLDEMAELLGLELVPREDVVTR